MDQIHTQKRWHFALLRCKINVDHMELFSLRIHGSTCISNHNSNRAPTHGKMGQTNPRKNRPTQPNNCASHRNCPFHLLWLARDLINRDNASFTKLLASVKNMPCFQEAWKSTTKSGKNLKLTLMHILTAIHEKRGLNVAIYLITLR